MKKSEKGFTLIELLAVIVILAVIALIIVPLVMSTIDDAKKGAFRDSAYGILSAGENYMTIKLLNLDGPFQDEMIDLPNHEKLKHKGTEPDGGKLYITSSGKLALVMYTDKYCAIKELNESDIKVQDYGKDTCKLKNGIETNPKISVSIELYEENQYAKMKAKVETKNQVTKVKYMKGKVDLATISKKGIDMIKEEDYYVATGLSENGDYTIYAEDSNGKSSTIFVFVKGIVINPVINASVDLYNEDQYASLNVTVKSKYEIKSVKYIKGNVDMATVSKKGIEMIKEENQYTVEQIAENGDYTIYVEDVNGNKSITVIEVDGIVVLTGSFEDRYVRGDFGELSESWGTWSRTLNIETKKGVKIVDARYVKKYSYDSKEVFEGNANYGDKISHEENKLNYTASGLWLQKVTIYVKYEYDEEVSPGEFEKRYASKLYKTMFSRVFS